MTYFNVKRAPVNGNFNNLLDNIFAPFPSLTSNDFGSISKVPVNIGKLENGYELEVVAPGFAKEDFKLALEKDLLTISAEVKTEGPEKQMVRREHTLQSFKRSFTLDESINTESIVANYANGILTVTLQKKEEVKPEVKQITIN